METCEVVRGETALMVVHVKEHQTESKVEDVVLMADDEDQEGLTDKAEGEDEGVDLLTLIK